MENEEKEVITVENKGGKGNPNHLGKGAPDGKGGQFAKKEEESVAVSSDQMKPIKENLISKFHSFNAINKEKKVKEAKEITESVSNNVSEKDKEYLNNLSKEEKIKILSNDLAGYDKEKLEKATDEEILALLYINAAKNQPILLEQEITKLKQEMQQLADEDGEKLAPYNAFTISGVWLGVDKHPKDYKNLKESGSIDKKKEYYNNILNNENSSTAEKFKASTYLKKLEEFEEAGEEYIKKSKEIEENSLEKFEELENKLSELYKQKSQAVKFNEDKKIKDFAEKYVNVEAPYSQYRKNNATWISEERIDKHPEYKYLNVESASAKYFGNKFEQMWKKMSVSERDQLIDYTGGGFSKYNKPLRGKAHGGWKSWVNYFANGVTQLTNAINKCTRDEDIWVQRGVYIDDMEFVAKDGTKGELSELFATGKADLLLDTLFVEPAFYSSGAGKNTGFFDRNLIINTYCPRGTKMAYMNTKGHYADSVENEMILQRGYSYKITKVEKVGSKYYLDVEVVLGSDEKNNVTDMNELQKIGEKYLS